MSPTTETLFLSSSSSEEEVLIESATKQEYWLDDHHHHIINELQELPPPLQDHGDGVAAGSSDQAAAPQPAAAENNGFLVPAVQENYQDRQAHLFDEDHGLQRGRLPPLHVMNGDDHDQPLSTHVVDVAADSSENKGFMVPPAVQQQPPQHYLHGGHLQFPAPSATLGGGFGGHPPPIALISGCLDHDLTPPPMLQPPPYTQSSGGFGSFPARFGLPDQSSNWELSDQHQEYSGGSSMEICYLDHPSLPYQNQPQSSDQIITFPNTHATMEVMAQPIGTNTPTTPSSSTNGVPGENQQQQKKKHERWSCEEHKNLLRGIKKYGKGDWKSISREFVKSRTPVQIASHAQKLDARRKENEEMEAGTSVDRRRKRRSSIHDTTIDDKPRPSVN